MGTSLQESGEAALGSSPWPPARPGRSPASKGKEGGLRCFYEISELEGFPGP